MAKTPFKHSYNADSVNKAIKNASRFQGKISKKGAKLIHALLKGNGR